MKNIIFFIVIVFILTSCKNGIKHDTQHSTTQSKTIPFSIIIHGGAGYIKKENLTPEKEKEYREKLEEAISVGYTILKNGGSSLDAVEKTINVLEDSPLFNAGKGAVLLMKGPMSMTPLSWMAVI